MHIVHFDTDHLNHVEKPRFFHDIDGELTAGELLWETVLKVSAGEFDSVRSPFEPWNVAYDSYLVEEAPA